MRAMKLALLLIVVAAWVVGWERRAFVFAAYTDEREPIEIRLQGIDQLPDLGSPSPSPYALVVAGGPSAAPLGLSRPASVAPAVSVFGGTVVLSGIVLDNDDQPLTDATVRIERVTSDGSAIHEVVSDEEGRWSVVGLAGGRYRVRAFVPGLMRSVDRHVRVLGVGAEDELVSRVGPASPATHFRLVGPEEIIVGTTATIAVTASREFVDGEGIVVETPIPGLAMTGQVSGTTSLLSADEMVADVGGAARFLISCDELGAGTIAVASAEHNALLVLPPCVPVPEIVEDEDGSVDDADGTDG